VELKNGLAIGLSMGAKNINEAAEYFVLASFVNCVDSSSPTSCRGKLKKFEAAYEKYKSGKIKVNKDEVWSMALQIKKNRGDFE
jgi:hypothetical protein